MKYSVTCFEITTFTLVIFYSIQSYSVKYPNPRGDEYVEQKRKSYKIYVSKRLNNRDQRKSFERSIHSFELFSALSWALLSFELQTRRKLEYDHRVHPVNFTVTPEKQYTQKTT